MGQSRRTAARNEVTDGSGTRYDVVDEAQPSRSLGCEKGQSSPAYCRTRTELLQPGSFLVKWRRNLVLRQVPLV